MGESAEKTKPKAVKGEDAQRIKREALGIGDRRKHHTRKATPLKGHVKEADAQHRLYRFRFYPTEEQAEQLGRTFGACRWVCNDGLALRSGAWEQHHVDVGFALNEAIFDAAWGELLRQLRYKCEWYGRTLVVVDRFFPSTRRCSACHAKGPKCDVSVREWTCTECGVVHDRDVNAAVNLRDEGMRLYWLVAAGLPPGKKVPTVIKASELEECLLAAWGRPVQYGPTGRRPSCLWSPCETGQAQLSRAVRGRRWAMKQEAAEQGQK